MKKQTYDLHTLQHKNEATTSIPLLNKCNKPIAQSKNMDIVDEVMIEFSK